MATAPDWTLTEQAVENMLAQRNADLEKRATWTDDDFVQYMFATFNAMHDEGAFSAEWTSDDVFSTGSNPIQKYGLLTLATVWGDQESLGAFTSWPLTWQVAP